MSVLQLCKEQLKENPVKRIFHFFNFFKLNAWLGRNLLPQIEEIKENHANRGLLNSVTKFVYYYKPLLVKIVASLRQTSNHYLSRIESVPPSS